MTTIYIKQNGTKVTIEVTEEMAEQLKDTRRKIWRNEARARYHNTSLDSIETNGSVFACASLSPEEALIEREGRSEERAKLKRAIATLTAEQRQIVHMRFVQRLELKEIALLRGVSKQAIFNRLEKIIKKIKNNF